MAKHAVVLLAALALVAACLAQAPPEAESDKALADAARPSPAGKYVSVDQGGVLYPAGPGPDVTLGPRRTKQTARKSVGAEAIQAAEDAAAAAAAAASPIQAGEARAIVAPIRPVPVPIPVPAPRPVIKGAEPASAEPIQAAEDAAAAAAAVAAPEAITSGSAPEREAKKRLVNPAISPNTKQTQRKSVEAVQAAEDAAAAAAAAPAAGNRRLQRVAPSGPSGRTGKKSTSDAKSDGGKVATRGLDRHLLVVGRGASTTSAAQGRKAPGEGTPGGKKSATRGLDRHLLVVGRGTTPSSLSRKSPGEGTKAASRSTRDLLAAPKSAGGVTASKAGVGGLVGRKGTKQGLDRGGERHLLLHSAPGPKGPGGPATTLGGRQRKSASEAGGVTPSRAVSFDRHLLAALATSSGGRANSGATGKSASGRQSGTQAVSADGGRRTVRGGRRLLTGRGKGGKGLGNGGGGGNKGGNKGGV